MLPVTATAPRSSLGDLLVIEGGTPLSGRVQVGGNKNGALPIIAACLLTEHECVIENVPRIRDVEVMAELVESTRRGRVDRAQHPADQGRR